MIFIYDNGKDYSSHSIEFLDVPKGREAEVDALMKRLQHPESWYREARILGVFEVVEWRDPASARPWDNFLKEMNEFAECWESDDWRDGPASQASSDRARALAEEIKKEQGQ